MPEEVQKGGSDLFDNMETASERYSESRYYSPKVGALTIEIPKQSLKEEEKPGKSLWDEFGPPKN